MIRITIHDSVTGNAVDFELDWDFDAVIEELEFAFPELQGAEEVS